MSKKPQKFETLTIKYSAQPEHIAIIKDAAKGLSLETFFHMAVLEWLEKNYFPKRIYIEKNVYQKLAARATAENKEIDQYASECLRNMIKSFEEAEEAVPPKGKP